VTHAPASRAVASLARKEYVTVKPDPEDRRVRRVELTASGMAILEQDPVHKLTDAIDALSSEKRKDLATMLETLYARLVKPT
jgi:hypothetical protein